MYSHQRSKVTCMWKIIFVECRPVGGQRGVQSYPNAIAAQREARFVSNTCQKMWGGKHVKVKKRQHQDILRFRADSRKLILGSIGTPLDHLSVKVLSFYRKGVFFWGVRFLLFLSKVCAFANDFKI